MMTLYSSETVQTESIQSCLELWKRR